MEITQEGDWHIFREQTTKSYERFLADASRALMGGVAGLMGKQHREGNTIELTGLAMESTIAYDHGKVTVRVRFKPVQESPLFPIFAVPFVGAFWKDKVLSDVEAITRDVCDNYLVGNRDVFIVHGHDDHARMELKALLGGFGLRPVVLVEQDDRGLTIIEKFEYYASDCSFAFVLMTGDDPGGGSGTVEDHWRARQNVIMELGWFMARLGRDRVVILHQRGVESPSDIHGVVVLEFDKSIEEVREGIRQRLSGVQLIDR